MFYKQKFTRKLGLLLLTFAVGTASVKVWREIFPPIVSVCEAAQNIEGYDGQRVRLLAEAHTIGGMFILRDDLCNMNKSFASITLPENYQPASAAVRDFISQENLNFKSASILITGRIDAKSKFQCHQPKFVIKAEEIELISEVMVR